MDRHLQLPLRSSRIATRYCVAVILISWLAIWLADLPLGIHIFLTCISLAYGVFAIRVLHRLTVSKLEYRSGNWHLCINEQLLDAELDNNVFLGAGIISMQFRVTCGVRHRVVLWPDSADQESLRRLRVQLLAG